MTSHFSRKEFRLPGKNTLRRDKALPDDWGRAFQGNAANTIAAYLRSAFKKRGWAWPKNPLAWKRHFIEHHVEVFL